MYSYGVVNIIHNNYHTYTHAYLYFYEVLLYMYVCSTSIMSEQAKHN